MKVPRSHYAETVHITTSFPAGDFAAKYDGIRGKV